MIDMRTLFKQGKGNLKGCMGVLLAAFLISHFSFRAVLVWVRLTEVGTMMTRLAS